MNAVSPVFRCFFLYECLENIYHGIVFGGSQFYMYNSLFFMIKNFTGGKTHSCRKNNPSSRLCSVYTTYARFIHLPCEKKNCIIQNSLILVIHPYGKATGPIWKPGMMFFLNPFINEDFGNAASSLYPSLNVGVVASWWFEYTSEELDCCSFRLFNREYSPQPPLLTSFAFNLVLVTVHNLLW